MTMTKVCWLMIVLACLLLVDATPFGPPEGIHLGFGYTPDMMTIQWSIYDMVHLCSSSSDIANQVEYYENKLGKKEVVIANCFPLELGSGQIRASNYVAQLSGLKASTRYKYRIGDGFTWSEELWFVTSPDAATLETSLPHRFMIYGDLAGSAYAPDNTSTIMPLASAQIQSGHFDMILHVGDLAYDLQDEGGSVGRQFMNEISNMSSYVPYMVNAGNHEEGFKFAHYTEYFRSIPSNQAYRTVTTDNGVAPNNWFYSWNYGLVHFVTIAAEIYYNDYLSDMIEQQFDWFKADLEIANANRSKAPWIIVNGHRSIYCSCDSDCDGDAIKMRTGVKQADGTYKYGLESLLNAYGVDMWFNGHEHNYERMYDIEPNETFDYLAGSSQRTTTNPPGPIYIVTGDAGNGENHKPFIYPQPSRTAYRTVTFGYGSMNVYNSSHLLWEQIGCDETVEPVVEGGVIDSFWLVQHNHGPFTNK